MDISAMLSNDNSTPPPAQKTTSNGNGNVYKSSIVSEIRSSPNPIGSATIDNAYKSSFQFSINSINNLDKRLELSNTLKLLRYDEAKLNSTVVETRKIASNHIDRVVAEDISTRNNKISDTNKNKDLHHLDSSKPLHHNTTRGREYKWGSTREINKVDPKPKRKKQAGSHSNTPVYGDDTSPVKSKRRLSAGEHSDYETEAPAHKKPGPKPKKKLLSPSPGDFFDTHSSSKRPKRKAASTSFKQDDEPEYEHRIKSKGIKKEDDSGDLKDDKKQNSKEQKALVKQYDNTYVAIWKDLSRKDGPKVSRLVQQSTQAKLINLKKTSILAAREAKRWQLKNNKGQKDLTTKARRAMREMFNFWKRNERIERELRKKHEKELIDKAKKEEEEREAKRQSRKLNFLITQTELYSHFIGKKIKTEEIEGKDSDPNIKMQSNSSFDKYSNVDGSKKHDINSLDFDNDDDEFFNNAAAANAQNALEAAQSKARAFDTPADEDGPTPEADKNGDEMNFQNPTLLGDLTITQPKMLKCTLKEYQVKGLNWLANLYEQGINGILADEMGLGKTVQSISVLSYLAEHHNIWGPFLVVTPASTLHNWQQEISKFVPNFKVLPYWGNGKDRKILRKFWDRKNVRYGKDAPFHVLVTSYQLVVADAAYFQKMRWQYMILDEAQAIKSSSSSRWKSLLSFSCRNRLLLTGTPIQNSMQELWALLHFIMPSLFDSHDEFSDWFSKDIESHAQSNTNLDEKQLRRLHMILKPFMLRRIKKNVQSELGDKVEIDIFCDLTNRQQRYYQMLKSQISIMDLLDTSGSSGGDDSTNLINLVMQFRKVCNHPDLFERADVKSSLSLAKFAETSSFLRESSDIEVSYTTENFIEYDVPRLVYDELLTASYKNDDLSKQGIYEKFNIYDPSNTKENDQFSWLRLVDSAPGELKKLTNQNIIDRAIDIQTYTDANYERASRFKYVYDGFVPTNKSLLISEYNNKHPDISNSPHLTALHTIVDQAYLDMRINNLKPAVEPKASAPPITVKCSGTSFMNKMNDVLFNTKIRASLMPLSLNSEYGLAVQKVPVTSYPPSNMLPQPLNRQFAYSNIRMPSMTRFITDAGKLAQLDKLLIQLKKEDHRVLIYFQMTKMMDLMEEYLTYKQHTYIRLDGSSKLDDRRDLVHDWQSKPEIFIFLLSTRAGGLGINLTAADTVIFYDSDWNPTIDSQAMDRAHRLGQTRQVTVYRLLARGTIEERMRDRAKQKEQVQQVVMEGKAMLNKKEEASNKKKDVAFLLLGGDDTDKSVNSSISSTPAPDGKGLNTKRLEEMYHEGEGKFSGTTTPSNG